MTILGNGDESEISQSHYSKGGNDSLIACADAAPSEIASGTVLVHTDICYDISIDESTFIECTYRNTKNFTSFIHFSDISRDKICDK